MGRSWFSISPRAPQLLPKQLPSRTGKDPRLNPGGLQRGYRRIRQDKRNRRYPKRPWRRRRLASGNGRSGRLSRSTRSRSSVWEPPNAVSSIFTFRGFSSRANTATFPSQNRHKLPVTSTSRHRELFNDVNMSKPPPSKANSHTTSDPCSYA